MPESTHDTAQVKDARSPIRALLPPNTQARVLGGIALLMVLVIAFSGRKAPEKAVSHVSSTSSAAEPNPPRIQEYQTALDEATRKLTAEEEQLTHAKASLNAVQDASTPGAVAAPSPAAIAPYREAAPTYPVPDERKKLEYRSLFASNVALTYRSQAMSAAPSSPSQREQSPSMSLPSTEAGPKAERQYQLLEGTILETVLTNRLDSTFSGPVNCMVTTNVYSRDKAALLIPQGTRVLGEARKVESQGDQRLAVFFHRLIRPDGYSISLDRFQGLSQSGETGLLDQIHRHYLQIFGASLAIGAIAGLAQANTRGGVNESAADAYQQGVESSLSQSSMHVLDHFLNVLPTFTIREGQRIKIYFAQDLTMPTYADGRQ